jgi:hypothetical protein
LNAFLLCEQQGQTAALKNMLDRYQTNSIVQGLAFRHLCGLASSRSASSNAKRHYQAVGAPRALRCLRLHPHESMLTSAALHALVLLCTPGETASVLGLEGVKTVLEAMHNNANNLNIQTDGLRLVGAVASHGQQELPEAAALLCGEQLLAAAAAGMQAFPTELDLQSSASNVCLRPPTVTNTFLQSIPAKIYSNLFFSISQLRSTCALLCVAVGACRGCASPTGDASGGPIDKTAWPLGSLLATAGTLHPYKLWSFTKK